MNVYYARRIGIAIKAFWIEMAKIGFFAVLCMLVGTVFTFIPVASGYINLGIKVAAYLLLFIPVMWFFVLNAYEKNLVKTVMARFKRNKQ